MKATQKSNGINTLLNNLAGKDRVSTIRQGACMFCDADGLTSDSFRGPVSLKEYTISGLCQDCQDDVFQPFDAIIAEDPVHGLDDPSWEDARYDYEQDYREEKGE